MSKSVGMRISTKEAAKIKSCTPHAIRYAIKQDYIDAERYGKFYVVLANKKFDSWNPNLKLQKAVRGRLKKK